MAINHDIDGDLPLNAQNPPGSGFTFNGSGQSAHNYNNATLTNDGINVGLLIVNFQGDNYMPTGVDPDGTVDYSVMSGPSPNNPNRAEWSFNYSVDQIASKTLDGHPFELTLAKDGTVVLDLISQFISGERGGSGAGVPASSHLIWVDKATGQPVIVDDGHNTNDPLHVSQNSQNIAFFTSNISNVRSPSGAPVPGSDGNPFGPGHVYDITLAEIGTTGIPVVQVHDHIMVV